MLIRARAELVGAAVLAADGALGNLEDIYFDLDWWETWYLVVAAGPRILVPAGCIAAAAPARRTVILSPTRAQLRPRAWLLEDADWLAELHIASVRAALGWRILADDGPAGTLDDLLIDLPERRVAWVVARVDTHDGARRVLIPPEWIETAEAPSAPLRVRRSRAELSSAPGLEGLSPLPGRGSG